MPKTNTQIFTNPMILVATSTAGLSTSGTTYDVSSWFRSATLELTADDHDDTSFGLTAHSHVQGLYAWSVQGEAFADYGSTALAAGLGLDSFMYNMLNDKVKFNVWIRPTNGARSSDNPEYGGPVRSFSYRPVGGNVGDPLMTPFNFQGAGNFSRSVGTT